MKQKLEMVFLGTGFTTLEALWYAMAKFGHKANYTVVSPRPEFLFAPNAIHIPFGRPWSSLVWPLGKIFERRNIQFVPGEARLVDADHVAVKKEDGVVNFGFDQLFVGVGGHFAPEKIPGLAQHGLILARKEWAEKTREALRGLMFKLAHDKRAEAKIILINCGGNFCSGPLYEVAHLLERALSLAKVRHQVQIQLYTPERSFVSSFGLALDRVVTADFNRCGIDGYKGYQLESVAPNRAFFRVDGESESVDFTLLLALAPEVPAASLGLPTDPSSGGFIKVDPQTLAVEGHPNIHAAGNATTWPLHQGFIGMTMAGQAIDHIASTAFGQGEFQPLADLETMCIMDKGYQATFANVPFRLTGDPQAPLAIDLARIADYLVGTSRYWRFSKLCLGQMIPFCFTKRGVPFHHGRFWRFGCTPLMALNKLLAATPQSLEE